MSFIVGLAGPAKVGKTTTANALVALIQTKKPKLKVTTTSFARPLYQIVSVLTGVSPEKLAEQGYKDTEWNAKTAPLPCLVNWTPRKLLQKVGTEFFRNGIDNNIWVESAIKNVSDYDIVIVSDARFENEYESCDYVIELSREGVEYACDHPSAMPPPKELMDDYLVLFPEISFDKTAKKIISRCTTRISKKSKRRK